jgi:hypothetical protein
VTTVGSGTDNAVLRISRTYEVRGVVATPSSDNNVSTGAQNWPPRGALKTGHFEKERIRQVAFGTGARREHRAMANQLK